MRGRSGSVVGNPSAVWLFRVMARTTSPPVNTSHGHETDVNGDGTGDVVVGTTSGFVYVYHGRVGPLTGAQFRQMLPTGADLRRLVQATRSYVGPDLEFDVQLVLRSADVPTCRLNDDEAAGPRLGWNTWTSSLPFEQDVKDAVFSLTGLD